MDYEKVDQELSELRGIIDFLNQQVGVYMDCLAGFQGNVARVERQIARVSRPVRVTKHSDGQQTVVWASLEDPSSPDVIHSRIMRATDYVAQNAEQGFNEQQVCWSIIVFIFAKWDEEVRPRMAAIRGILASDIKLDAFGDLRVLRIAIVHNGGLLTAKDHAKLKVMGAICRPDELIALSHDGMHQLFVFLKQAIAALILEHTGQLPGATKADQLKDIAIQKSDRKLF